MKLKNKLVSVIVAASALGFANTALAADASTFTVTKYNLTGFTDQSYINDEALAQIKALLREYSGNDLTVQKLNELKDKIQTVLNQKAKGIFTVNIPNQRIVNETVEFNINYVAGKVNYGSAEGFNEENVRRSIPSLQEGVQFVAGRPWIDERDLTMAVENPLKLTQVEYELRPNEPIVANVNVIAPRGNEIRFVTLDNSLNNPSYDYLRLTAGYVHANLTNRDDVLSLLLVSNLKKFQGYHAFGGSYSLPFYRTHQRLDFTLFHSATKIENFQNSGISLDMAGKGDVAAVNWSYYLPHYDWSYSNQLKLQAGYTFKRLYSQAAANGTVFKDEFYFASPFSLGVTGKIVPFRGLDVDVNAKYNFMYAGYAGTDPIWKLRLQDGRAETAERYQDWYTLSLNSRYSLPYNMILTSGVNGFYSNKHLVASERYSNSVRGFREGAGSGDKGVTWKNELISPNFSRTPNLDVRVYGFFDYGYAAYNRLIKTVYNEKTGVDEVKDVDLENNATLAYNKPGQGVTDGVETTAIPRSIHVASTGVGARFSYKDFSADVYVAQRLKGDDGKHGATSVWFSANYKW